MQRTVLYLIMLLALVSGVTSADTLLMPYQCQMKAGEMTAAIHHPEASKCSESRQACDQICVAEARILTALYLSSHWDNNISSVQREPDSKRVLSGFSSPVYHPPQA